MDSLFGSLPEYFPFLAQYKYLILFLASTLEGFNTILVAGFLIAHNVLHPVPTFFLALAGEMTNSFIWYGVGYWGGAGWVDWFVGKNPKKKRIVARIRRGLIRYSGPILLLVKMTWSITVATIILTGSMRYPLKKFALYNVIGSIGWVLMILSLGYFLGTGFQLYIESFRNISFLVFLIFISLVVVFGFRRTSQGIFVRILTFVDTIMTAGEKLYQGIENRLNDKGE